MCILAGCRDLSRVCQRTRTLAVMLIAVAVASDGAATACTGVKASDQHARC
jgi:hypothetical protein